VVCRAGLQHLAARHDSVSSGIGHTDTQVQRCQLTGDPNHLDWPDSIVGDPRADNPLGDVADVKAYESFWVRLLDNTIMFYKDAHVIKNLTYMRWHLLVLRLLFLY